MEKKATTSTQNNGRKHNGEKSKSMELPRHVAIGHGVLENIGEICKYLHFRGSALIVVDKTTKRIAGNRVEKLLTNSNYDCQQVIIEEANAENLKLVKDEITENKAKFILGVGGGRPIDIAKLSSFEAKKPFVSVPTAASHDGIVSSQASMVENRTIHTHPLQ